jgi:hypothetical protein
MNIETAFGRSFLFSKSALGRTEHFGSSLLGAGGNGHEQTTVRSSATGRKFFLPTVGQLTGSNWLSSNFALWFFAKPIIPGGLHGVVLRCENMEKMS